MISVTTYIDELRKPINWDAKAKRIAKEQGLDVESIKQEWSEEKEKGLAKGKHLNDIRYADMADHDRYKMFVYEKSLGGEPEYDKDLYTVEEGWVYDEMPFMDPHCLLIGIPDRVTIKDGYIHIDEYKADKKIYTNSYRAHGNRFAPKRMLLSPVGHLPDCNYFRYALQASLYMYLVWQSNKHLIPGDIRIIHKVYDDDFNELESKVYNVHYLRREVEVLMNNLKNG
jgi:hypothetical protein